MSDQNNQEAELDTSVASARAVNLRETRPELFTGDPKDAIVKTDDNADAEAAAAAAAAEAEAAAAQEQTDADAAAADGDEGGDPDAAADAAAADAGKGKGKGDVVPRARLNEVVARNKDVAAERDALRERLAEIDRTEQARIAAEAEAAANPPRNIEAEMDAIEERYENGDIDAAEKRALLKPLEKELRKQVADDAVKAALAEVDKRDGQRTLQTAAELWQEATGRFLADPVNVAYKEPIRAAALNEAMKAVTAEHEGKISHDELLSKARDRVEVTFGGKPSAGAETAQQRVARERREAAARAAAAASTLPERPQGGVGARGGEDAKEVESISRAEWRKLPQAKKDELLGKTPTSA